MSKGTGYRWRVSLWLPGAGIALSTPFLVWFAIGDLSSRGGFWHEFGPYDVGPESGYVVGGVAAVVALAASGVLVIRSRQGVVDWRSWAVVAALAGAGSLAAAGWRVLTAGVRGHSPAGFVAGIVVPVLVAGLLVAAVWLAGSGGRQPLRRTLSLTVAAVLVAPLLFTVQSVLSLRQTRDGLITARQYAGVRICETRSVLREKLGHEARADFNVFPPVAAGLQCDYYYDGDAAGPAAPDAYQFCFRAGVLVSKGSR
ncbi:MAG TPA: hypothetical protein VF391_16310 [Dermatophilaceae bacterium]|jgi:hypothetical protein